MNELLLEKEESFLFFWQCADKNVTLPQKNMSGWQTQMFHPTDFVDITKTRERKYQACYCHKSQNLTNVMKGWHTPMEQFRGIECRCTAAEAFAHHIEPLKMD